MPCVDAGALFKIAASWAGQPTFIHKQFQAAGPPKILAVGSDRANPSPPIEGRAYTESQGRRGRVDIDAESSAAKPTLALTFV